MDLITFVAVRHGTRDTKSERVQASERQLDALAFRLAATLRRLPRGVELVVLDLLIFVAQDFVGFVDFFEVLGGLRVVLVHIRVIFPG